MNKKILTISIVILFLGLAFAPSIHANTNKETLDSELVEITTEVCGLPGLKPQTVKLTEEESEELENLFDVIKERLDSAETREETVAIFNDAIVELDTYGLLGGLSIKQAQRLVTGRFQNPRIIEIIEKIYKKNQKTTDIDKNILCLVAGVFKASIFNSISAGPLARILSLLTRGPFIGDLINFCLVVPFIFMMDILNPVPIWHTIYVGQKWRSIDPQWIYYPSIGWLHTTGVNGVKNWSGSLYGQLRIGELFLHIYGPSFHYPGVQGFTGIKINVDYILELYYYMGFALQASLDPEHP